MILEGHGIRLDLPRGWSGRIFNRSGPVATLHAASFPLALGDGEFGDATTARMPEEGSFVALTEYRPGGGLEPGVGLFAPRRIPRRTDPTRFSIDGLAHPRRGQSGMQHFFTAAHRPFCLYVVIAGARAGRRRQLAVIDRMLGALEISPRHWSIDPVEDFDRPQSHPRSSMLRERREVDLPPPPQD